MKLITIRYIYTSMMAILLCIMTNTWSVSGQTVVDIQGKDSVCIGELGNYFTTIQLDAAFNYTWSLSPLNAGIIQFSNITGVDIQWQTSGNAIITLTGIDPLTNAVMVTGSKTVFVQSLPSPFITVDKRVDCRPLEDEDRGEGGVLIPPEFEQGNCLLACAGSSVTYYANGAA